MIYTNDFSIMPFPLVHNSHVKENGRMKTVDCQCHGFLIKEKKTGEKMLWITDTMYVPHKFPSVEYICIELDYIASKNYLEEENVNKVVEKRRFTSHLSYDTCKDFLLQQDMSKTKSIRLLHTSKEVTMQERQDIKKEFENLFGKEVIF